MEYQSQYCNNDNDDNDDNVMCASVGSELISGLF